MPTDPSTMTARLKKRYAALLLPAVAGFVLTGLVRYAHPPNGGGQPAVALAPAVFLLAALAAVAGPIFYRSLFAHRRRHLSETTAGDLLRFERNLTIMGMAAVYLALIAFWLQVPRFHFAGTLLLALYGAYTGYPSNRRIALDTGIFRARSAPPGDRRPPAGSHHRQ